jgi:integrase
LVRRLTALKNWHVFQGFDDPTANPAVRKTLTGIKNTHGKPKDKAVPLTVEALKVMAAYLKNSGRLIDIRNNALLQIRFLGAFRRSELVAIRWEHIRFVPEGIEILIPRSKTDQSGEGQVCAIPYADNTLCPVSALTTWREQSGYSTGWVFRQMTKGSQINIEALKSNQVSLIIKTQQFTSANCRTNAKIFGCRSRIEGNARTK